MQIDPAGEWMPKGVLDEWQRKAKAYDQLARALRAITGTHLKTVCDNPAHKPLRFPLCSRCQLMARIEEARAILQSETSARTGTE